MKTVSFSYVKKILLEAIACQIDDDNLAYIEETDDGIGFYLQGHHKMIEVLSELNKNVEIKNNEFMLYCTNGLTMSFCPLVKKND